MKVQPDPATAGSTCTNAKREKKERQMRRARERKGIKAQMVKPPTTPWETDMLIGDEEKNGKQKEEQKKETGTGALTQLPWTIWSPLTTRTDDTVGLF